MASARVLDRFHAGTIYVGPLKRHPIRVYREQVSALVNSCFEFDAAGMNWAVSAVSPFEPLWHQCQYECPIRLAR